MCDGKYTGLKANKTCLDALRIDTLDISNHWLTEDCQLAKVVSNNFGLLGYTIDDVAKEVSDRRVTKTYLGDTLRRGKANWPSGYF